MKKVLSLTLVLLLLAVRFYGQDDIEIVNIENQAVQDYMADAKQTYEENPDFRVSVIAKYNKSDIYGDHLYWPAGKYVEWEPPTVADSIREVLITVSEKEDYSHAYTFHPDDKDDCSFTIRILLPNRIYHYKVEVFLIDGTSTEMLSGKFKTVGQVRMIQVRNSRNVRDIGGWPTQYGVPVKYGRLYRSASLERMNREGRHDFVDNLKVEAELDLRLHREVTRNTSCLGEDKDYIRITNDSYMTGMTKQHRAFVLDLRWIIDRMREHKNVDWHCAIGCDRCGTLSFLIEGLLGLSELDLCRDYELSTFSLAETNKRARSPLKSMIKHIKTFGPEDNLARCFYNYWMTIGMRKRELDFFLQEMLDSNFKDTLHRRMGVSDIEKHVKTPDHNPAHKTETHHVQD